jgi:hypothetical protein
MQSARSMHGSFQRPCGAGISDGEGPAVRSDFRSPPGGGQKFAGLRHRGPAALACGDFFLAARVLGRVARNTTANSFGGSTSVARARDRIAQLFPGRCGAPPGGVEISTTLRPRTGGLGSHIFPRISENFFLKGQRCVGAAPGSLRSRRSSLRRLVASWCCVVAFPAARKFAAKFGVGG